MLRLPVPTSLGRSLRSLAYSQVSCLRVLYDGDQKRKCLFNDAHNTFSLRLYVITRMVKDYSDSERGDRLSPRCGFIILISSKGFLCAQFYTQDSIYRVLCYNSCGALAGMRNNSIGPLHHEPYHRATYCFPV